MINRTAGGRGRRDPQGHRLGRRSPGGTRALFTMEGRAVFRDVVIREFTV
jgi:hypothetical protein